METRYEMSHVFRVDMGSDPEIVDFVRYSFTIESEQNPNPPPISDEKFEVAKELVLKLRAISDNRRIQTWSNVLSYLSEYVTLVSGLYKGGTSYATNFLKKCGVRAGHEQVFSYDGIFYFGSMIGTQYDVEVSGGLPPWLSSIKGTPVRYLTVVRHPVDLVNSRYYFAKAPDRRPDEILGLQRDVLTQFELNMTVMKPEIVWRIESLADQMKVLDYFGKRGISPAGLSSARKAHRNKTKHKGPDVLTWDAMIPPLKAWAERLGYSKKGFIEK
jgi:hypothetical protein